MLDQTDPSDVTAVLNLLNSNTPTPNTNKTHDEIINEDEGPENPDLEVN